METEELIAENESELKVVYIHYVGVDSDGMNVYHFLLSDDPDSVFGDEWGEKPSCNCPNLMPEEDQYQYIKELKTNLILDLAQKNCCFSLQDCRDHVLALASENLDNYEEYPEPCRVVIQFGDSINEVETMLAKRELRMKFI